MLRQISEAVQIEKEETFMNTLAEWNMTRVPTMVDIINGMFCVSYQIIRNHKECGGILYPFDGYF